MTEKRKGLFGSFEPRTSTCGDRHPSDVEGAITGTLTGQLVVWRQRCVVAVLRGFDDCVTAIRTVVGAGVVACGADCSIRMWLPDLTPGVSRLRAPPIHGNHAPAEREGGEDLCVFVFVFGSLRVQPLGVRGL